MSRYTRWVRKQAKARALGQVPEAGFSGAGTALAEGKPSLAEPGEGLYEQNGSDHPDTAVIESPVARSGDRQPPANRGVPVRQAGGGQPASTDGMADAGTADAGTAERGANPRNDWQRDRRQPFNEGWLWRGKILAGDIAVVVGEEGSGKSQVVADWIARVTSGRPFPGQEELGNALPPSDVLVFNTVEDFGRGVLDLVADGGGDPGRVLQATTQLLDWGRGHGEFPDRNFPRAGEPGSTPPETRVRLHTQDMLAKLREFLLRRPSIRLVVIDQLKHHVRTDSERVFEDCLFELLAISRETEVAFVCTQRPDAFRNAPGVRQYLKSDSLMTIPRSIWRVAPPDDPAHGDRVLQCLKLNYHGPEAKTDPWRLWQKPGQPMCWKPGNREEFPLTKLEAKEQVLFHAKTFISLYLQMFGGLADYQTMRLWARREGITAARLFEATMVYNIGYLYEPGEATDEDEFCLKKIIGSWDQIRQREAIDEAERPPVLGPPEPKRRRKPAVPRVTPTPVAGTRASSLASSMAETTAHHTAVAVPPAAVPVTPVPAQRSPAKSGSLESLRAQVARGEARLREFPLEGFRFMKPNLATAQMLLHMAAEMGSAQAMFDQFREGLTSLETYSPDDVEAFMDEYHRFYDIACQLQAADASRTAA